MNPNQVFPGATNYLMRLSAAYITKSVISLSSMTLDEPSYPCKTEGGASEFDLKFVPLIVDGAGTVTEIPSASISILSELKNPITANLLAQ